MPFWKPQVFGQKNETMPYELELPTEVLQRILRAATDDMPAWDRQRFLLSIQPVSRVVKTISDELLAEHMVVPAGIESICPQRQRLTTARAVTIVRPRKALRNQPTGQHNPVLTRVLSLISHHGVADRLSISDLNSQVYLAMADRAQYRGALAVPGLAARLRGLRFDFGRDYNEGNMIAALRDCSSLEHLEDRAGSQSQAGQYELTHSPPSFRLKTLAVFYPNVLCEWAMLTCQEGALVHVRFPRPGHEWTKTLSPRASRVILPEPWDLKHVTPKHQVVELTLDCFLPGPRHLAIVPSLRVLRAASLPGGGLESYLQAELGPLQRIEVGGQGVNRPGQREHLEEAFARKGITLVWASERVVQSWLDEASVLPRCWA